MKPLGQILLDRKMITQEQLTATLDEANKKKKRFGDILIENGLVSETNILNAFADELKDSDILVETKVDRKKLDDLGFEAGFFSKFSTAAMEKMLFIPIRMERVSSKTINRITIHILFNDPQMWLDIEKQVMAVIKDMSGERFFSYSSSKDGLVSQAGSHKIYDDADFRVKFILGRRDDILHMLATYSGVSVVDYSPGEVDEEQEAEKIFKNLMATAIKRKASDVHIAPISARGGLWARLRIDGTMEDIFNEYKYKENEYNTFLNLIMNKAGMKSDEKRIPQSGGIQFLMDTEHARVPYDLRVEVLPTANVSKSLDALTIGIRILYPQSTISLENAGFTNKDLDIVKQMYTQAQGVILVTGPTSSGKTSTLYSILKTMNLDTQTCFTVEDPVEYKLEKAYQIPVDNSQGRTFALILRSLMRLDPNIVLIGEMRDTESAEIGMQIANTGHTVLSTLHTNSAYDAPNRLISMKIPDYLISSTLKGIIAQRLTRKNCPHCLEECTPNSTFNSFLRRYRLPEDKAYYRGSGRTNGGICQACKGKGYIGRMGIYELMPLYMTTPEYDGWQDMLREPNKLKKFFTDRGHGSLEDDAKDKLFKKLISPEAYASVMSREES